MTSLGDQYAIAIGTITGFGGLAGEDEKWHKVDENKGDTLKYYKIHRVGIAVGWLAVG